MKEHRDAKKHDLSLPPLHPPKERRKTTALKTIITAIIIIGCITNFPSTITRFLRSPTSSHTPATSTTHPINYTARAHDLLSRNPLVDGHVDLAILIRYLYKNHIYSDEFTDKFENGGMRGQVDLPRLDAGKYGGAFWSAFWGCPKDIFDFSDEAYAPIVRATLEQLDLYHRLSTLHPQYFTRPPNARTALSTFHSTTPHTLISPLAIEGLHQIGNSLSTLRLYHSLGVRYATLTWNCHNAYADAAVLTYANGTFTKAEPYWGGLSKRGREAVMEMNRMGMIVDLAHVSVDTMRDVLVGEHDHSAPHSDVPTTDSEADGARRAETPWKGSLAPPIFSHSSAYTLCPHPRNVPDAILHLVRARNSIVMVNFSPDFISCVPSTSTSTSTSTSDPHGIPTFYPANNTLSHVADHIMHIGSLIGYAHVGIGSDFDGIEGTPVGLEGVDRVAVLVGELLRRGVSEEEVVGVVGGNVMRVWGEVDAVAERMGREGVRPVEDEVGVPW